MTRRGLDNLSPLARAYLIGVINRFAQGGHPVASDETLNFFGSNYICYLLGQSYGQGKLTDEAKRLHAEVVAYYDL